ncbi:sigma-70 family RNA polymerase sigma factor [Euzebya tangerina]|uniref:sigma-70 family RNA polymerase sigma factor n=1 Tax=Euzebya tangerina TaxID=591198 RepID=UPI001F0CAD72|nr:sigma-70 family RNA polymerase sigma factor [Euzebya tangerina]
MTAAGEVPGERLEPETAFARAYLASHAQTVRLAYLLTGDASRAEELAHDAWVNAYRRHRRQPIDDLIPYVRRAVVNATRSRGRRSALERAYVKLVRSRDHSVAADESVLERDRILVVLNQLSQRMRTAVVLRHWLDLSVAETARLMGVTEGTVKSTVHDGLARLRTLLDEEDADG